MEEENKATTMDVVVGMDMKAHTIREWSYPRKLLLLTQFRKLVGPYV